MCIPETINPATKKRKATERDQLSLMLLDDRKMKLQVIYYTPWILFMTNIEGFALNANQFVLGMWW